MMQRQQRQVLVPFDIREAMTIKEAGKLAGRVTDDTVRDWCAMHAIGRKVVGRWHVSRVALAMFLDGDRHALAAYHSGDRAGPLVRPYFERAGLAACAA